jgi:hypothetical protein
MIILLGGEARLSQAANSEIFSVYLPVVYKNFIKGFTNPGFENGAQGWTVQSNQGDSVVTDAAAHTGQRSAGLGNGTINRVTSISQSVKIPQSAYGIQYYQYVDFPLDCTGKFSLMVFVNNEPYKHYICDDSDKGSWIVQKIHFSSELKGTTINIKLEFQSSSNQDIYLYVDDFSFQLE